MRLDEWLGLRWQNVDGRHNNLGAKTWGLWGRELGGRWERLTLLLPVLLFGFISFGDCLSPIKHNSEDLKKHHPPPNHQHIHHSYPWALRWYIDWSSLLSRSHQRDFHFPLWACHSQPGRSELFLLCIPRLQTATASLSPRAPRESKGMRSVAMQGPHAVRSRRWHHSWGCRYLVGPCWWGGKCNGTDPENQRSLLGAASLPWWTQGAGPQDWGTVCLSVGSGPSVQPDSLHPQK